MHLKLELAKQRKESLQKQTKLTKNEDAIDRFKKHWAAREEAMSRNVEMFKLMEEIKRENIMVKFIRIMTFFLFCYTIIFSYRIAKDIWKNSAIMMKIDG